MRYCYTSVVDRSPTLTTLDTKRTGRGENSTILLAVCCLADICYPSLFVVRHSPGEMNGTERVLLTSWLVVAVVSVTGVF